MTQPIYAADRLVATLEADGPRIQYDQTWREREDSFPISLSMPLADANLGPDIVTPWLMNLLPEGDPLRAMTRAMGVSQDDVLGLVARTGGDIAGALSIGAGRPAMEQPSYRPVPTDGDLERIIGELPAKPFLVGEDGVSMSLAGAQEKLPVALVDGELAIPINGASSTHILKPDNQRLLGSVQNEALCMVLARRCGISVAPVTTGLAGERSYLLVERYDRRSVNGVVERLHQEDFCQALGKAPLFKYEFNGSGARGPSLADLFDLVRSHMTARDINRLLDAVIFNIAVGNVDSHAKNYSILIDSRGVELAPLYDLMSGLAWANITHKHAQAIGGQLNGRHIYRRHWLRLAEACGLSGPGVLRRLGAMTGRLISELPRAVDDVAAMPAGRGKMLDTFAVVIAERARLVQNNAARDVEGEPPPGFADDGYTFADA